MLRKLIKNKKAQNTAEYAILIALVVAAIIAMQTYAQRALQARVRDASQFMTDATNGIGTSAQYEPYYQKSDYAVTRNESETEILDANTVSRVSGTTSTRDTGGYTATTYDNALMVDETGGFK